MSRTVPPCGTPLQTTASSSSRSRDGSGSSRRKGSPSSPTSRRRSTITASTSPAPALTRALCRSCGSLAVGRGSTASGLATPFRGGVPRPAVVALGLRTLGSWAYWFFVLWLPPQFFSTGRFKRHNKGSSMHHARSALSFFKKYIKKGDGWSPLVWYLIHKQFSLRYQFSSPGPLLQGPKAKYA